MTSYCCAARTCPRCVAARKQRETWDRTRAAAEAAWSHDDLAHDMTAEDIKESADASLVERPGFDRFQAEIDKSRREQINEFEATNAKRRTRP